MNVEIDFFYYTALGPFYGSRVYMRKHIRMSFDCWHFTFFFCVYMEEDIRRNWSKLLYGGLHLDQQPSEPVYLKNDGIKILLLKKFLLITKSVATMLA